MVLFSNQTLVFNHNLLLVITFLNNIYHYIHSLFDISLFVYNGSNKLAFSDIAIQTGSGNMAGQVSRSSIMSSLKRSASQPLSSTDQNQHRKTMATQFIRPSIPTRTRLAPSVPITSRAISPLAHPAQYITPRDTQSVVPPFFPTNWTKSALPAPNTTQAIPPKMHPPPNYKRISSSHHPSSYTSPRTNLSNQHQLLAQALCPKRLKASSIPAVPRIASNHIKFKGISWSFIISCVFNKFLVSFVSSFRKLIYLFFFSSSQYIEFDLHLPYWCI